MKLPPRELPRWRAAPEADRPGALIYGGDAVRVAQVRRDVVGQLVGPQGDAEMRLTRLAAADLRSDKAALIDAMTATGFFPGPRVVVVSDATDGLADVFAGALETWQPGDAQVIATAGQLTARGKLRKLFEAHPSALAVAIYDDPPGRAEIEAMAAKAGLPPLDRAAMGTLEELARGLPAGDFRQTFDKLALYKLGDAAPVTPEEILAQAPRASEAGIDDICNAVAEGQSAAIGPLMQRLAAQGVNATSLCIGASRHFRQLYAAAADPGGPQAGIARLRPPVFGPRRDRMQRQAARWGVRALERALAVLMDTDLGLRSSAPAPQMAVMERTLIRLAMMGPR